MYGGRGDPLRSYGDGREQSPRYSGRFVGGPGVPKRNIQEVPQVVRCARMHGGERFKVPTMKGAPSPVLYTRGGFTCVDNESEKAAQLIRILDVLVIGPAMLYAASEVKNPLLGAVLAISGAATTYYNGRNWLLVKKSMKKNEERGRIC